MVLQDHVHPPLSVRRHAFHNAWATYLTSDLNQRVPADYFAEPNVQFGVEIDVAALEEEHSAAPVDWHHCGQALSSGSVRRGEASAPPRPPLARKPVSKRSFTRARPKGARQP
jgi:hypothetical protein